MSILERLIEQSRLPKGVLGNLMLRIMNNAHKDLTVWGISQLSKGNNILDVSCGGGAAIKLIVESKKYTSIYGIDISEKSVALATSFNQSFIDKGIVNIMQASVTDLPFEDNSFDAITTFQSHYHWTNVLDSIKEIYKKLKPNGKFVLVAEVYKIEYHMKEYNNAQRTRSLLIDAGFKSVELLQYGKCVCAVGIK